MEPIVVLNLYLSSIAFPPVGQYHGFFIHQTEKPSLNQRSRIQKAFTINIFVPFS